MTDAERRLETVRLAMVIVTKDTATKRKYAHVLKMARNIKKYYKIDFFQPYDYQRTWFKSGSECLLRYLSAANQIGKTFSAACEFSYHATGRYPDWWNGFRCGHGILWAVGISTDSTRTVLQKELLGTADARQLEMIGTGTIPREFINMDSIVRLGETVKSIRIKHISGEESEIRFYSATQDETVYMGQRIVYGWIDEQSPNEIQVIAQATTRTTNTGGCIAVTATPEIGITEFYAQCRDDTTGKIHFQNATWDDAPHITGEVKANMLARIPYFQRKMRSLGIPVLGVGAIYPYSDEQIIVPAMPTIPDSWRLLRASDFGYSGIRDPSVLVDVAYDEQTDIRYIVDEWGSEADRDDYANSHLPDYMARKIVGVQPTDWDLNANGKPFSPLKYPSVIVKVPHDGAGLQPGTQSTRAEIMRAAGADVHHEVFQIPPDMNPLETNRRSLIGSIGIIAQWMQDGKLKICSNCVNVIRELRLYQWKKSGQRTIPSDVDNHFMDAMRIGAIRVRDDGNAVWEARQTRTSSINDTNYNSFDDDMKGYDL